MHLILNMQQGAGVQERCNIYLYPNGEDSQIVKVILENLRDFFSYETLVMLDDANPKYSLMAHKNAILEKGKLWIVHQDKNLYNILVQNAQILPQDLVCNGIVAMQDWLVESLKTITFDTIRGDVRKTLFLNLASLFSSQFLQTSKANILVEMLKGLGRKISVDSKKHFKIPEYCVGVVVTSFAFNKHLGNIGVLLEKMGVCVVYVYNNEETLKEIPPHKDAQVIVCPLSTSYMGRFLNLFKAFVTCLMPLPALDGDCKMIYVSHAFIDPIAALVQRRRPLDDFWFEKKVGICGFRMLPSLSSYKIYKDKFKELGFEEELVCAGYPSLDSTIKEYEELPSNSGGGGQYFDCY